MPDAIPQTVSHQEADRITRILRLPDLRQRIKLGSTAIYE